MGPKNIKFDFTFEKEGIKFSFSLEADAMTPQAQHVINMLLLWSCSESPATREILVNSWGPQKVAALKAIRTIYGWGLVQAKAFMDVKLPVKICVTGSGLQGLDILRDAGVEAQLI